MSYEKILKYVLTAAGVAGGLLLLPFTLKLFAPFVAAFLIAVMSQPLVRFLEKKLKISRGISSAVLVTGIAAAACALICAVTFQFFVQIKNLVLSLPAAINSFREQLTYITERYDGFKLRLSPEISDFLDDSIGQLRIYIQNISKPLAVWALDAAKNFAAALPGILLFFIMFILGTFFFTKDYMLIINFLRDVFSDKAVKKCVKLKNILIRAFSLYFKAQLILMLMTSVLTGVALWIAGMDYPLIWGGVCGIVDALPFFGTAAVLVPWALISLVYGDVYSFAALLIIQATVFLVRQLSEPRIVSRQIGIHPILTLVSVYVGIKFFGVPGMILAPILMLLAVNFYVLYRQSDRCL